MARFTFCSINFCFLLYLVSISYAQADNTSGPKRTKWSIYSGLVPFPRIGRARIQNYPAGEMGGEKDAFKRDSVKTMMPFLRVGRSEALEEVRNAQKKSTTAGTANGLWFGPRLGRIHKRRDYKQDVPMAYVYFGDYTPRLGRESEEMLGDGEMVPEIEENDKSLPETV